MRGNPIKLIKLQEMLEEVYGQLSHTLAGTEIGRMLQLISRQASLTRLAPRHVETDLI